MNRINTSSENNIMNTKLNTLVAIVALASAVGCGEAVDINRVGPNVTKKDIFVGEWYYRSTIVDKQFANADDFIGFEGGMDRIRWEVTEHELLALRSYERLPGSDPANPGAQNLLAVFPIVKHFDIKRDYNTVNGVESNVIIENDFDRPWWERDYMRVDWSSNTLSGLDPFFFGINWVGMFGFDPARGTGGVDRIDDNNPTYPWRTRVSEDYIETTLDGFHQPDWRICRMLDEMSPCNSTRIKIKMSFRKLDPTNDYVPLDYPDFKTVKTGNLVDPSAANDAERAIFTSTSDFDTKVQRMCTGDEVGPDGSGQFLVRRVEGLGTRMCNTSPPPVGDGEENCERITAVCEDLTPLFISSGPEDVSFDCDININDPDSCFEFTTPLFARFGFFRTDRFLLDRENGTTLEGRERLINRWNVWKKSHDDDGNVLPYSEREPKPIVYYTNVHFPPELKEANQRLEKDWDTAFTNMLASAKGVSALPKDGKNNDVFDVLKAANVEKMFQIRENDCNVKNVNKFAKDHGYADELEQNGISEVAFGNLEQSCAVLEFYSRKEHAADPTVPVFTWQQTGDLRYAMLNWTPKPELAGPLGYGPSAADPITGEIVNANANIYGASLDTYSNWGADVVQLINGELQIPDVQNGSHIREHVEAVRNRWNARVPRDEVDGFMRLVDQRTAAMDDDAYLPKVPLTAINANFEKLAGSDAEAKLMTNEVVMAMGGDAVSARDGIVTDAMMEAARPTNFMRQQIPTEALATLNPMMIPDVDQNVRGSALRDSANAVSAYEEYADYMGRHNMCFLAGQVEPAIADLARQIADRGLTREETVKLLREQIYIGVTAHELGHTFGLRHNFEASADPINFFPEYWDVADLGPAGEHMLAKSPNKDELMYSSIMDYTQRFNSDFAGIGLYDKAAIKLGYAEKVEVFDETEQYFVARDWLANIFLLSPQDIPFLVGGPNNNNRIENEYNQVITDQENGDDLAFLDIQSIAGVNPNAANIYRRRDIDMKDWLRNETLMLYTGSIVDDTAGNFELLRTNGLLDDDGRAPKVAVPYTFCSDAYAWGGNLTCNRWDKGVTSREIVKNAGEMYDFYYPFNAFKGQKVNHSINGYLSRLYQRTYQPMLNAFRYFYYYRRSSARIFPTIRDWSEASIDGMNFFYRVLQTPDTGRYCNDGSNNWVPETAVASGACTDFVDLDITQARTYRSRYDQQYDFHLRTVGQFWEKLYAINAMTDSEAFFFRDFSSYVNRGAFSIGYYRVFPQEMLNLFGGLITGDTSVHTPGVSFDADGKAVVNYGKFLTTDAYGDPIPVPPPAGDPITPSASYTLRIWSAFLGMANLTSTLDQTLDFASRTRIAIAGSASDPTFDPTVVGTIVDFTNPETLIEYRSAEVDGPDSSIGVRALQEAKDFAEGEYAAAKVATEADPDDDDAAVRFEAARQKLDEKMEVIEFLISLGNALEYPI